MLSSAVHVTSVTLVMITPIRREAHQKPVASVYAFSQLLEEQPDRVVSVALFSVSDHAPSFSLRAFSTGLTTSSESFCPVEAVPAVPLHVKTRSKPFRAPARRPTRRRRPRRAAVPATDPRDSVAELGCGASRASTLHSLSESGQSTIANTRIGQTTCLISC